MCFTPAASLTTAIIEFLVAGYLLVRSRDKRFYPLIIFVSLLGFYQFTEFMLCTGFSSHIWATLGFITYTFMPVLLMHLFMNLSKTEMKFAFYSIPAFFSLLAIFYPGFITYTSCNLLHVSVENFIFHQNITLLILYMLYYVTYPGFGLYQFFTKGLKKKKLKDNLSFRIIAISAPITVIFAQIYFVLMTLDDFSTDITWIGTASLIFFCSMLLILSFYLFKKTYYSVNLIILASIASVNLLLYILIPAYSTDYASIFCQFAILYTIGAVLLVESLKKENVRTIKRYK